MIFDIPPGPPSVTSQPDELWLFLPFGYLLTVLVEAPVLVAGLSRRLTLRQRFFAGFWLTACTYPIVVLVMPAIFADAPRGLYLLVAETFAPLAECVLFWLVFSARLEPGVGSKLRNFVVIIAANILSFIAGELLNTFGWFGLFGR